MKWILPVCAVTLVQGLFVLQAEAARVPTNKTCLSYFAVGDSGCDGTKKPQEESQDEDELALPEPILEEPRKESMLPERIAGGPEEEQPEIEEKIDDFLTNFEKPPREFARFQLEPTVENALAWVQKYNQMVEKSGEIAAAWRQAQQIYDTAQQRGIALPGMKEERGSIPDYQQQIAEMFPQLAANLKKQNSNTNLAGGNPQSLQSQQQSFSIGGFSNQQQAEGSLTPPEVFANRGGGDANQTIKISYYYSSECPYCERFEPEFNAVIKDMGDRLDVTCVDMSPTNQNPMNIQGKIDCTWRPLGVDEMERMGVTATPTLIIDRGDGTPLQRIPGYVDGDRLKTFLETNQAG